MTITDLDLDRTDTTFEAQAVEAAETLCLLASFLSKATVTWYARTIWSDGRLCENYRLIPEIPTSRLWWQDVVLDPKDVRRFLGRAFTAYQKGDDGGISLRLPILTYVAAQSAPTVEQQFILLFIALEKVIDMLDPNQELLTRSELKKIAKSFRCQLRSMGKDAETIEMASEKTRELSRPAFRRRLYSQIERLKVSLDDVGGLDALRHTVGVRDSLIHSAGEVPIEAIVRERKRLETVVERVLLAILNWRGSTNTPTRANRLSPAV